MELILSVSPFNPFLLLLHKLQMKHDKRLAVHTSVGQVYMKWLLLCLTGSPLTVQDQFVAGLGAGVFASLIACPTELIKCRLQVQLILGVTCSWSRSLYHAFSALCSNLSCECQPCIWAGEKGYKRAQSFLCTSVYKGCFVLLSTPCGRQKVDRLASASI